MISFFGGKGGEVLFASPRHISLSSEVDIADPSESNCQGHQPSNLGLVQKK